MTAHNVLKSANMHIPVGTKSMRGTAVIDSTMTTYSNYSGLLLPSSHYWGKGTNTPELRIEYDYDSFGNLAYAVKDGTVKTVFLWGYHGRNDKAKCLFHTRQYDNDTGRQSYGFSGTWHPDVFEFWPCHHLCLEPLGGHDLHTVATRREDIFYL